MLSVHNTFEDDLKSNTAKIPLYVTMYVWELNNIFEYLRGTITNILNIKTYLELKMIN